MILLSTRWAVLLLTMFELHRIPEIGSAAYKLTPVLLDRACRLIVRPPVFRSSCPFMVVHMWYSWCQQLQPNEHLAAGSRTARINKKLSVLSVHAREHTCSGPGQTFCGKFRGPVESHKDALNTLQHVIAQSLEPENVATFGLQG